MFGMFYDAWMYMPMGEKTKTVYIMLIENFCYRKCEVLKSSQSLLKMNVYRIFCILSMYYKLKTAEC